MKQLNGRRKWIGITLLAILVLHLSQTFLMLEMVASLLGCHRSPQKVWIDLGPPDDNKHVKTNETMTKNRLLDHKILKSENKMTTSRIYQNRLRTFIRNSQPQQMETTAMPKPNTPKYAVRPTKGATTSDFSWKTLSEDWKLFSSYIDNRSFKSQHGVFGRSLVTMGYERGQATDELQCVVIWSNNTRTILKDNAVRDKVAELWKRRVKDFRSYVYRCKLSVTDTPRYLTLISKNSTDIGAIPRSSFVPVVDSQSPVLYEFGVCFETPLFGDSYKQIIIDSIEMNRILGAQWFTMYVHDAGQAAMEILRSYSREGILDGIYNWGKNIPSPIYMKGVLVGIQDCLYRNMYKVRYLVYCDLDEVIIPRKHLNWHDLIDAVEGRNRGYFIFNHVAFHKNLSQVTEYLRCPGEINRTYHMPHYLATRNRSVNVFRNGQQSKCVIKPSYSLFVHVHHHGEMIERHRHYFVSPDLALLQHFRNKDDPRFTNYNSTIDFSMEKYKLTLLNAVKKRICGEKDRV